jgi:hypothetical protein
MKDHEVIYTPVQEGHRYWRIKWVYVFFSRASWKRKGNGAEDLGSAQHAVMLEYWADHHYSLTVLSGLVRAMVMT